MSEVINSYNLVWSTPVCQQEVKRESLFEVNNFLFTVEDLTSLTLSFLFFKLGESLLIDFNGDEELNLPMGINSEKILPVTFETVDEVIDIDFSLS
jgi:hypothetical protein